MSYTFAHAEEQRLHLSTSAEQGADFALRAVRHRDRRLFGLHLPAPGLAEWTLPLPRHATFSADLILLEPPIARGPHSDGATVVIEAVVDGVRVAGESRVLGEAGRVEPVRVDLGPWAGRVATLRVRSEPGADPAYDHVFLAEPAVYTPDARPGRLLVLFVDTLRPDRLGTYGHDRPTSPRIDALADSGVVFENARSVSPWTLPSVRSLLTGRQPERFDDVPHLAEHLAAHGWSAVGLVSNAFLSEEFGNGRGWTTYGYRYLAPASFQVEQALEVVSRHADRDLALMVHFMEPHLPYREKGEYRRMWAGDDPPTIGGTFGLRELEGVQGRKARNQLRPYLFDRYDQNVRALDDQLDPLLDAVGPDATVVLLSDHGEEFWEHGGLEHGHALFDEVMRIPLIVRDAQLSPRRVDAPVSLLDVPATLLDLLGLPPLPEGEGRSLVGAARGDPTELAALRDRPTAFGRTLRGSDAYGVLRGDQKWIFRQGRITRFDLAADPVERHGAREPLDGERPEAVAVLEAALDRPVVRAIRLAGPQPSSKRWDAQGGRIVVRMPGGFGAAWSASSSPTTHIALEGDTATLSPGPAIAQETWLVPIRPDEIDALALRVEDRGRVWEGGRDPSGRHPELLARAGEGPSRFTATWDWVPSPPAETVPTTHPAREEELRALGYGE